MSTTMTAEEILSKLVSFPVLGGMSNLSIADWIVSYLAEYGIEYHTVPNEDGTKQSIHCRIGPAVDDGVILSGHMDVVPVEGQDWCTDPFHLTDKGDGKLYGRGSCDMKGFLACCLAALPYMKKANLKRPIYFAFSYDEEVGCVAAPALADDIKQVYKESPKYALIGEPSRLQPILGQKGIAVFRTTVSGSQGHSSRIRTEVSAIHEAARLILWLEQKMDDLISRGSIDNRFTPPHTSIHCGLIDRSGIAHNVIADTCTFVWDVRVIPSNSASDIVKDFEAYCRHREKERKEVFPAFEIRTELFHPDVPPLDTPGDVAVVDLIKRITGRHDTSAVSYAAEAGHFSNAGFQSVICGPGDIAQAHRANEFIEKEQLNLGVDMIHRLVDELSV